MDDTKKQKVRDVTLKIITGIGIIEVIIAAVILILKFHGLTDLSYQIIVHVVIALAWVIQGFVVHQMDWMGAKFVIIAVLEMLVAFFGLYTLYSMTDYVVRAPEFESVIPGIRMGMSAVITPTISGIMSAVITPTISGIMRI